jgi:hypothetical protein
MDKRQFILLSGWALGQMENIPHANAARDGRRGSSSMGRVRLSITIGHGGRVHLGPPQPDTTALAQGFGAYLCTQGQYGLTLCHPHIDTALLTAEGDYLDGQFVMHNSRHTLALEVTAHGTNAIPLLPHTPVYLGAGGARPCPDCDNRTGTRISLNPLGVCRHYEADPYTGTLTFRVEQA